MSTFLSAEFLDFLTQVRLARGWSTRDLARRAGISHSTLSLVYSTNAISFDTCARLATALNIPPVEMFVRAGLIPADPDVPLTLQQANYKFSRLPEWQQRIVLNFIESLLNSGGKVEDPEHTLLPPDTRPA